MSTQDFTQIPLPKKVRYGIQIVDTAPQFQCLHCGDFDVETCYICGNLTCKDCLQYDFEGAFIHTENYICEKCGALPREQQEAIRTFRLAMEDVRVLEQEAQ